MDFDILTLESRVRRTYERARGRHALRASAPLLGFAAVLLLDHRPVVVLGLTSLLFAMEALFLWRGQQLGRGAVAGLAGGAIPLAFGLGMQIYGGWCGDMAGIPGCTAICTTGGLLAGAWIGWKARAQPSPLRFLGAAAASAIVVGAIGCAHAGTAGVFGMTLGVAVPLVAARAQALFASRPT